LPEMKSTSGLNGAVKYIAILCPECLLSVMIMNMLDLIDSQQALI